MKVNQRGFCKKFITPSNEKMCFLVIIHNNPSLSSLIALIKLPVGIQGSGKVNQECACLLIKPVQCFGSTNPDFTLRILKDISDSVPGKSIIISRAHSIINISDTVKPVKSVFGP